MLGSVLPYVVKRAHGSAGLAVRLPVSGATHSSPSLHYITKRTLFGQKFEIGEIHAVRREVTGSKLAQWARQHQLIPGIVYGYTADGGDNVELIYVKEADLRKEVNKRPETFTNTLFDITIDGVRQRVLARDFQIHPFKPKAICINWLRYREGAYPGARIEIPLKTFNEERCPALKEGGWLLELTHKLPVYASGAEVPDYLMMDLRGLKIGDKIMASQLILNEGLSLRSKVKDFAVAKLVGSRRGAEEEEEGAAKPAGDDKKAAMPAGDSKAVGDKGKAKDDKK